MPNRIINLISGIVIGIISSLIAWVFTKDWKLGIVLTIVMIMAFGMILSLPLLIIRLVLHFNKSGILKVYLFQEEAKEKIGMKLLSHAKEIDVLTIRGLGIFGLKDSLLRQHILDHNDELKVRLLLLNPASSACSQRALEIKEDVNYFTGGIKLAINGIGELKRLNATNVEARLYNQLPVWRIIRIDDNIFVSSYLPSRDGHMSPMYRIQKGAVMSLFPTFVRQFDEIWGKSKDNII
jgi:hypothetical protein